MLYIGSCAKSGTHYVVDFLNCLGIKVRHEYPGIDGIVTWYIFHTPNDYPSYLNIDMDNSICLHQTREPIATIASIMALDQGSWGYIRRAMSMDLGRPILSRSMEYYYQWHKSLENCTFGYPVEDIMELVAILDLYKLPYNKEKLSEALELPKSGASFNKPDLSWNDLFRENWELAGQIKEMAGEYGYFS